MKLFEHIEVSFDEQEADYITDCLWCGSGKLSVSKEEGNKFQCWSCKKAGNALTYMRQWYEDLTPLTMPEAKQFISYKEGVPPSVLRTEGIKYEGGYFWFPVRKSNGDIVALHKYNPDNNITYASPKPWNCSILGIHALGKADSLWVAEGHADYLIARSLIKPDNSQMDLLGTCGSGFSSTYLHLLADKDVVLLFDNDDAGRKGVESIARRIKTSGHSVRSLYYIDWSRITVPNHSELPDGFDLRDLFNAMKGIS